MLFRELNRSATKTYLIGCEKTQEVALIDPVLDKTDRYLALLAYYGYTLGSIIDTHTHADHLTGSWELRALTDAPVIMHRRAPAPHVDVHVEDGQLIRVGTLTLHVLATPGHTPDSMCLHALGPGVHRRHPVYPRHRTDRLSRGRPGRPVRQHLS